MTDRDQLAQQGQNIEFQFGEQPGSNTDTSPNQRELPKDEPNQAAASITTFRAVKKSVQDYDAVSCMTITPR